MNNVLGFLEAKLMPLAAKTAQQRHLGAIRGAYVSFMPFIIVGSILLVISSFPNQAYQQFMSQAFGESWSAIIEIPFNAVFSTMSLFISFLVAYRLAEHYGEDRISCGILALVAFLILTPFIKVAENGGITVMPVEWIGSKGLFVAMIGSLLWTELFCWLKRKKLVIKMPDGVPPAVQESFAALIPALLVMILVLIIRIIFENTHYHTIHQFIYEVVATPVRHYGTSYFGALMTVFSITILWSVGINSGSMINGIIRPLWMENQTDNIAAIQAGTTPPHIITEQFFDMIWMGGAGATLSLVIAMLIFARSKNMREVARLGAGASVFNINEPILFGAPIIMNPMLFIPFVFVPLVNACLAYGATKLGWLAQVVSLTPWTTPAPIGASWAANWALSPVVMCLVCMVMSALMYLPFLRAYERTLIKNEEQKAQATVGTAETVTIKSKRKGHEIRISR
ncbi:PTS lactose transporter subunit IIC [Escherichia coli]|nr:PTS lactose transporter subunit IIC [Escherichia coli]